MSWFKNSTFFEKICALAFIFFAIISCITTAHSLTLTFGLSFMPDWAVFVTMFIVAFFVYILTSYCFKQMIDSNNDAYCASIHKSTRARKIMFWRGLLGVIFFWLVISLPTNIHSMLFVKEAKDVAKAELGAQREVLDEQYKMTDHEIIDAFHTDSATLMQKVGDLRERFEAEVTHQGRPGLGDSAKAILNRIEIVCNRKIGSYFITTGVQKIVPTDIVKMYDPKIFSLRDSTISKIKGNYYVRLDRKYKDKLMSHINEIDATLVGLDNAIISIDDAHIAINNIYNTNESLKNAIYDKMETLKDKEKGHVPENVERYHRYRLSRLYNVYHAVVDDFFNKRLPFDMLYLILCAAILDIAALVFSGIAFRGQIKTNNNNNFLND